MLQIADFQIDQAQVTLFLWSTSVLTFFMAIEVIRQKDRNWAIGYFLASVFFAILGFAWPYLPTMMSSTLEASADQIYRIGAFLLATLYALARRKWVRYGQKGFMAGFGEGIVVVCFATLALAPLFSNDVFSQILVSSRLQFFVAGVAGLYLVFRVHDEDERYGQLRERLRGHQDEG